MVNVTPYMAYIRILWVIAKRGNFYDKRYPMNIPWTSPMNIWRWNPTPSEFFIWIPDRNVFHPSFSMDHVRSRFPPVNGCFPPHFSWWTPDLWLSKCTKMVKHHGENPPWVSRDTHLRCVSLAEFDLHRRLRLRTCLGWVLAMPSVVFGWSRWWFPKSWGYPQFENL